MKRIVAWAVLGLALAGCVVPSVYPFYTEKDLVFEPALVGIWRSDNAASNDKESFTYEKSGESAYKLTYVTDSDTNVMSAHLFKLNDQFFMDWWLLSDNEMAIPPHYLMKVRQIQPMLKLSTLKVDWLKEYAAKNPDAIRHTMALNKPGASDEHVVLTADTKELQKFILKYLDDTNAWIDLGDLKHEAK